MSGSHEQAMELELLRIMDEYTPKEYTDGYFFPFGFLAERLDWDREVVRGFCRSLRNKGFLKYGIGFCDDGRGAGGGYSLTAKGYQHLNVSVTEVLDAGIVDYG